MSKDKTPNTTTLPNAEEGDLEHLPEEMRRLSEACKTIHIEIPAEIQEHEQRLIDGENALTKAEATQGFLLLAWKERIGHGQFQQWIESQGFNPRSAQQRMQVARFLLEAPASTRPKLAGLGQSKLHALAQTDIEVIDDLLDENREEQVDWLDEINQLSVRDLRQRLKELKNKNSDLSVQLDTEEQKIKELRAKLKHEHSHSNLPEFAAITRHESHGLTYKSLLCLDDLEELVNETRQQIENGDGKDAAYIDACGIACGNLYTQIKSIAARATSLFNKTNEMLNDGNVFTAEDGLRPEFLFSDQEVLDAIQDRADMIREHEQERVIRENKREMDKPRKRGRPKKASSNTAGV